MNLLLAYFTASSGAAEFNMFVIQTVPFWRKAGDQSEGALSNVQGEDG